MTLAPERTQTRTAAPRTDSGTSAAAPSTENPNMPAAAPARAVNSRLSVTSAEPRPQRPEFKKSGSPNPASHLSPEQIEEIGRELDVIRAEVMDSRGASDAAYIRKVIKAQRYLEMGSRAALLFSGVKYKGVRPMWWLGTAGLSVAKILENMELGHNIMHGQWDWMRDPKIHSTAWEWDHASPAEQWKHSHNQIHHTFTNVLGRDNDLGYGILRVDQDQRWSLFYLFQPVWHVANALLFEYSIAAYDLELGGYLAKKKRMSEEEKAEFHKNAQATLAKIKAQMTKDYVVHPALSAATFTGSAGHTFTANVVANLVRNVWSNTVIICGHFPPGIETFEKASIEGETRGEWYLRQMLGSGNIHGSKAMHLMSGNLSHQIEHHLFPDMPSNRYAQIAPKIRDLMERNDLKYVSGSLAKQVGGVYWKVVELSLPPKREGTTRRATVLRAAKKVIKGKGGQGRRY